MANVKISELTTGSALGGTEYVPIVQNGVTVKTTAQAIANLGGGGGGTFEDNIKRNADRIALIKNVTVSDWSWHIYSLASGNYFLGLMTVPFVVRCKTKFTRALGGTTIVPKLTQFGYVANSVINTGRILSVGGFLETGDNSLMVNGISSNLLIDSTDFPNTYSDVSITESSASYASNNSPLLFRESQIYNLDEVNSHPLAVKMFGNGQSAIIADYIEGNGDFTMFDVCTVGDSDVPQGFNLADMTQAYLLYTSNDMFILIIADSNWGGLYVDGNGKLNSYSGDTVYCSPYWNASPSQYNNQARNLPIAARTSKPPFAEGNNDNYAYHVIYNTEDILDSNNNVVIEKNVTIGDFKTNLFNLT